MSDTKYLRKNYYLLDIGKFLAASLIVCAHFVSENCHLPALIDAAFSVYVVSVPFFFTVSGFLFFEKFNSISGKKEYFVSYIKRIALMYLSWSLIYLPFIINSWIKDGELSLKVVLSFLYRSVVFTSYPTIWFLPALFYSVILIYFLNKKLSPKTVLLITFLLFIFGSIGYSYSFLQEYFPFLKPIYNITNTVFLTTRNGIFHGAFYVALGNYISTYKKKTVPARAGVLAVLFAIGFSVEAVLLKYFFKNVGADTVFLLIPFTYFAVRFCISINLKEKKIYFVLRKISLLMFVSQRLFLSAIPGVWPGFMSIFLINEYLGIIMMLALVIAFSVCVFFAGKKLKFLKILM